MDPANADAVKEAITHQGYLLGQHEQTLRALAESHRSSSDQLTQLTTLVNTLSTQMSQLLHVDQPSLPPPSPTPPTAVNSEVHMPTPEPYDGNTEKCRGFLMQLNNVFTHRSHAFAAGDTRISFLVGLLRGRALEWAEARLCGGRVLPVSYGEFLSEFQHVFDHPSRSSEAATRLNLLRQGRRPVSEYAIDFRTLAVESGWNEAALRSRFMHGLSEQLRDELVYRDEPGSLDELIALCIRLDNRIRERRAGREYPSPQAPHHQAVRLSFPVSHRDTPPPPIFVPPMRPEVFREEPMQLGRTRLTPAERHRRRTEGECMYCASKDHEVTVCPLCPKGNAHQ